MTPRLESLLERLAPVVREEMLKVAVPNCCVATVAVLRRVFRHHGFEARALPVSVVIRNAKLVKALASGMVPPEDTVALHKWMDALGAWAIGIVPESREESILRGYPGYGGHLLCHVQDVLVDASLDQANRPEKKIKLTPFAVYDASPRFLRGEGMLQGTINGCEVTYRPLNDPSWRKAPDWKDERRYRETVNRILDKSRIKAT